MTRAELQDPEKRRLYFREYNRKRKLADPAYKASLATAVRRYRTRHKDKVKAYRAVYRKSGRWAAYMRRLRAKSVNHKIASNLRCRLWMVLKGEQKSRSSLKLLGCTLDDFKLHITRKFRLGMTWFNYGTVWHIDHIKPCAAFNLAIPEQQQECFHFSNMQPLFASENYRKNDNHLS